MKMISPRYLEAVNQPENKEKIINALIREIDILKVIMVQFGISFEEACEKIAPICFEGMKEAPEASEEEKEIMKQIAKEFAEKLSDGLSRITKQQQIDSQIKHVNRIKDCLEKALENLSRLENE